MRVLRSNVLGQYIPAFFEMTVNTTSEDMQIDKMSPKDRTVLFHEYIHFLQDFTTFYGLNTFYVHSEYIRDVVNRIYKCEDKKFPIPFHIYDDNFYLNQLIHNYTYGDDKIKNEYYIDDIIVEDDQIYAPEVMNPQIKSLPCVTLNRNGDMMSFGAHAIKESMAYIMEHQCSPEVNIPVPNYPYLAAEKVAKYYDEDFSSDLLKVLALCDMSLQCSNPGVCFVRIMEHIKDKKLKFESPEAIYDYCYSLRYDKLNDGKYSFIEGFKSIAEETKSYLKSYLRDLPFSASYNAWIDRLFEFAFEWREKNRYFLLDMARCNNLLRNNYWLYALNKVGTPLMSNNDKHEFYFNIPPEGMENNDAIAYFKAIYEVEKVFKEGSSKCSMINWCKDQCCETTPNEICETAPWKKVSEPSLCPFACVWKHWGLAEYEPQLEARSPYL